MKILIISALPYDVSSSTRAFRTYFSSIDKNNLAQIYTNTRDPKFEFCDRFCQITDKRMFKRLFNKKINPCVFFSSNGCDLINSCSAPNNKTTIFKKDVGFFHLIRNKIWKKRNWFTPELQKWIEDFNPDCVFYHNSNSIFLSNLAIDISTTFNLPLVVEISDDYLFGKSITPLLFETIYRQKYKKVMDKLFAVSSGVIYISEKMKREYEKVFEHCNSDYVHISSDICLDENKLNDSIVLNSFCYFGNTGLNRDKTLKFLGKHLKQINSSWSIDVFCPLAGNSNVKKIMRNKALNYCGFLPYVELIKKIHSYEFVIIAEPFDSKTAKYIGLSLSTKVADALALRKKIIAIGNQKCGTIDFVDEKKCGFVIKNKKELKTVTFQSLNSFKWDDVLSNSFHLFNECFTEKNNAEKSSRIFARAIEIFNKKDRI